MAYELEPHAERAQLFERYHAMADDELLNLAERPDDLTDVALEELRGEMASRRLAMPSRSPGGAAGLQGGFGWGIAPETSANDGGTAARDGSVALMTFDDAIAAGEACRYLEQEEIEFQVRDVSTPQSGRTFYGGAPVALEIMVRRADRERAVQVLREKMGLFPLQEVEGEDEMVDDGSVGTLGQFARRAEAEDVGRVLSEAGFWYRITANPEGTEAAENCYTLEVKEVDLMRAGEVVEKAMGLPEG